MLALVRGESGSGDWENGVRSPSHPLPEAPVHRPCAALVPAVLLAAAPAAATTYEIGPGQPLSAIGQVPWESLEAGDLVRIHARPEPYAEKWVVCGKGTEGAPIRIEGVPDPLGALPVISADGATTRLELDFWNEARGLLKIGAASHPDCTPPEWIVVQGLHLTGARDTRGFIDRTGAPQTYAQNAAALYLEAGRHVTIRGCELSDSGNGLFSSAAVEDLAVEDTFIHGNGNPGSIYEHNSYTAARGIRFQGNRYGPLCDGCLGNNLKDRSAGTVIVANWIEGGNRQLDLVDGEDDPAVVADPRYGDTFVYGNVLLEPDGAGNSQVVHFGGDSGVTAGYRPRLWFWNNTVVSTRSGNTTLFRLSSPAQRAEAFANVVLVTAAGNRLALVDADGDLRYGANWFKATPVASHSGATGTLADAGGNLYGSDPGFTDLPGQDFTLAAGSPCLDAGAALPAAAAGHPLDLQFRAPRGTDPRPAGGPYDLGAFERFTGVPPPAPPPGEGPGGCGCGSRGRGGAASLLALLALAAARPRRARAGPGEKKGRRSAAGLVLLSGLVSLLTLASACATGTTGPDEPGSGPPPQTGLVPPDRVTTWDPGILSDDQLGLPLGDDGLPQRATVCATLAPGAGIQAAIDACPEGQVVLLQAGTFTVSSTVTITRGVVLRGAGSQGAPTGTTIVKTGGGPVLAIGADRDSTCRPTATARALAADAAKESTTLTVGAAASGFTPGDLALVDQVDVAPVDQGDCAYFKRVSGRSVTQRVAIEAVDAAQGTLTLESPLHWDYRAGSPQLAEVTRVTRPVTRWAGIEHLRLQGGSNTSYNGAMAGGVDVSNAAYCWVKDVQTDETIGGMHVALTGTYRCVVRDGYFHHSATYGFGADCYGIVLRCGAAENLVENNVVRWMNKPILFNVSGGGNVVAYNYADNSWATPPAWQEVNVDCHCSFPHMELVEGNEAPHMGATTTHGNAGYLTFYRNHSSSRFAPPGVVGSTVEQDGNVTAIQVPDADVGMNVVGNVLGEAGWSTSYDGSGSNGRAIYRLGSPSSVSATTILRHGNWDTVSGATVWVPGNDARTLPPSLFRSSRPGWWPSVTPWPWAGPDLVPMVGTLPAKARSDAMP